MKIILNCLIVMFTAISILMLPSCSSPKKAPDPVKVQAKIAEYRSQELDLVRSTVLDEVRAERLIELLTDRDEFIAEYTKVIIAHRQDMTALNADYNAQRESFDLAVSGYNDQRARGQEAFSSLLKAMKQETTAEEWKVISKFQIKRLEPRGLTYNQPSGGA